MHNSVPVRLGAVGLGRAFMLMLPTFRADPRIELVAVADPRPEARARFTADFGGRAHASIEALAEDPAVEAIYVASPHPLHAAHAIAAARHGKHVLVEKPLAISLAECEAMIDAAERAGVHLVVGHSHSYDAPYLRTRALIDSGRFGRLRMLHAAYYTDFMYRPRRPEELDTAQGGGVVFSQGAHQVDIARLLAGGVATRVVARTGRWDARRRSEGAYTAVVDFAGGAFASLTYSGYAHYDADEAFGWRGELGERREPARYGAARARLAGVAFGPDEAALKAARGYGAAGESGVGRGEAAVGRGEAAVDRGEAQTRDAASSAVAQSAIARTGVAQTADAHSAFAQTPAADVTHNHFGMFIASCDGADLRPLPTGVMVYDDSRAWLDALPAPRVPRVEVIDELVGAVRHGLPPLHSGRWGMATLEVCLAILESARSGDAVALHHQVAATSPSPEDMHRAAESVASSQAESATADAAIANGH